MGIDDVEPGPAVAAVATDIVEPLSMRNILVKKQLPRELPTYQTFSSFLTTVLRFASPRLAFLPAPLAADQDAIEPIESWAGRG